MHGLRVETFEPEALARLGSAFDEAWAAIEPRLSPLDDAARVAARVRLAAIMLELTHPQLSDDGLKQRALIIFHRNSQAFELSNA
jgi:hypothetical protein